VGYATPQAMVRAFIEDEEAHLEAMVAFLIANEIADDLREHRWAVVARVYNGPGYRLSDYDGRMAAAYARWAGIKDTPWPSDEDPVPEAVAEATAGPPAEPVAGPPDEVGDPPEEIIETSVTQPAKPAGFFLAAAIVVALFAASLVTGRWLGLF
jgi:hypothetical protein